MTDYTPSPHINLARPLPDAGFGGGGNNNGFNKFLILFLIILTFLVLF